MSDQQIREALNQHWAASDAGDFAIEHDIYLEDGVLDSAIPRAQLGRHNIQIARTVQPSKKRFVVNRITGGGNVWTTECALTYDTQPFYTVSIMEPRGVKVAHETQYFAAP